MIPLDRVGDIVSQPLLRLRQFTTSDVPNVVAPRMRNTLNAVAATPRERLTLVTALAVVGLASVAVFAYLLRRRQ